MKLPKLNRRSVLIGAGFLTFVVVAAFSLMGSVYVLHSEDPLTVSLARWMNLPVARVGTKTVSYDDYLSHLGSLRTFMSGPAAAAQGLAGTIGPNEERSALERAIRLSAIEEMAESAGLIATPLDVERAYAGLIAQGSASSTPGEIQDLLRDQFGWEEKDFKEFVIRPALMEDALRAKRARETGDEMAFDKELEERLKRPDVVRYLRFQSLANQTGS
ncbi:hypothetical protein IT087_03710 [Candidatus Uhrbacteria bacterium]|nr:hypothetical protein [Candidatus Uhrbacteria bacterium]